jgi:hypothetical protein
MNPLPLGERARVRGTHCNKVIPRSERMFFTHHSKECYFYVVVFNFSL